MKRRDFLGLTAITALMLPFSAIAALWNKAAFDALSVIGATKRLAINDEIVSTNIDITAPKRAENGAIVPIEVVSHIPNTEAIAVFVENNPTALIGNTMFNNGAQPYMVTRIKMAETSDIKVVVKSGNQYFTTSKKVTVLENGCSASGGANEKFEPSMRMRAKLAPAPNQASMVEIKAIITHPMHTGQGKDDVGQLIPAHFIQLITITYNDKAVVDMQLGTGVSKNPYLAFKVKGAKLGDQVAITWHDNLGNTATGDIAVTA